MLSVPLRVPLFIYQDRVAVRINAVGAVIRGPYDHMSGGARIK